MRNISEQPFSRPPPDDCFRKFTETGLYQKSFLRSFPNFKEIFSVEGLKAAGAQTVKRLHEKNRSSHQYVFYYKGVRINFAKLTWKHLWWIAFFNMLSVKKRLQQTCFLVNFVKFLNQLCSYNSSGDIFWKNKNKLIDFDTRQTYQNQLWKTVDIVDEHEPNFNTKISVAAHSFKSINQYKLNCLLTNKIVYKVQLIRLGWKTLFLLTYHQTVY